MPAKQGERTAMISKCSPIDERDEMNTCSQQLMTRTNKSEMDVTIAG